ncbi:hypothetical protein DR046_01475 [Jannaschia formosa]|nr:hypothetical protein DR046_01475 [Jannaschia formosa]
MSLDWVVLTCVLVATGLAVMGTLRGGIETTTLDVAADLRGQVVRSSFEAELCPGGVPALQAHEDARAASAEEEPLDVAAWMETNLGPLSDETIRTDVLANLEAGGTETGTAWTSERVRVAALACEAVLRGLD